MARTRAAGLYVRLVYISYVYDASRDRIYRGRREGLCDILAAAGNPCVAAHSTVRALYAQHAGPLRLSGDVVIRPVNSTRIPPIMSH
jgi:hypothetical protein